MLARPTIGALRTEQRRCEVSGVVVRLLDSSAYADCSSLRHAHARVYRENVGRPGGAVTAACMRYRDQHLKRGCSPEMARRAYARV